MHPLTSVAVPSVNSDPIGVELAGALKNVYAIASGVAHVRLLRPPLSLTIFSSER